MAPTPLGDHNNRTQSKGKQAAHKPTQDDDDDRSDSEEPKPKPKAGGRSDANSTRKLREEFRRLVGDAEDSRGNINDTTVNDLSEQVGRANNLFDQVKTPAEAILDSRALMAVSDAGALKARQMKLDANAFDTDDFLAKLVLFMGGRVGAGGNNGKGRAQATQEDDDEDEDDDGGLKWDRVGRVLAGHSRRPPTMDLMLGPLELEVKEKKQRVQRQRQKVDETQRLVPEELDTNDIARDKAETTRMVQNINRVLEAEAGADGISYMKFVTNPDSFAQTVENIFYFSFLVRDNQVCIEQDTNEDSPNYGDYICFVTDPPEDQGEGNAAPKMQLVFELTEELWKNAIEAYDITESIIPTREGFKETKAGETRAQKWM